MGAGSLTTRGRVVAARTGGRAAAAALLLALAAGCTATTTGAPHPTETTRGVTRTPAAPAPTTPTTTPPSSVSTTAAPTTTPAQPPAPTDPLAGLRFYVNPGSSAAKQEAQWRAAGQTANADEIAKIAGRPQGTWLTAQDPNVVRQNAGALARAAAAARQTPVVVVYNLPHRDCTGGYSAGGATDAAGYRAWLSALAGGLGHAAPVVILEPDGIPGALMDTCLTADQRAERFALLAGAVTTLTGQTGAHVYLDAGNPGWVPDTAALAVALRSSGIDHAAGFVLNVANFYTTAGSVAYGHQLSQQLGGTHFVVDTSRNGNGPATDDGSGAPRWCNPPGRALGQAPTTTTGDPLVDAMLWVKNPGESDGACRPGAPAAGQWWADYALRLANASP